MMIIMNTRPSAAVTFEFILATAMKRYVWVL
jgi:hypothetical protein